MLRWKSLFARHLPKGNRRRRVPLSGLSSSAASSRRLGAELLEDRRMLAVMTVTDLSDDTLANLAGDGVLSLREAVEAINTGAPVDGIGPTSGAFGTDDQIVFDPALFTGGAQTITLVDGEFELTEPLVITGPGSALLTIDADQLSRIFNFSSGTGDLTLEGMTLTNGRTTANTEAGGAVRFASTDTLTINGSVITNSNTTGIDAAGGGVYANGTVVVTNSTISGNSTTGEDAEGGGLYGRYNITLTGSTVSGNSTAGENSQGGGVYSFLDSVILNSSVVSGNNTTGPDSPGGGIYAYNNVTLTNSTVSDNRTGGDDSAGGGVYASTGNVTVTNSMITGNRTAGTNSEGGGVYAFGNISITDSTVSGNFTLGANSEGGGIYSGGTTNITNSTVSDNRTEGSNAEGGGVFSDGALTVLTSTITGNRTLGENSDGAGLYTNGTLALTNSTVSGNSTTADFADGAGLYADGTITIFGSTISGNSTAGEEADGAGIYAVNDVTITNSTISGNFTQGANANGGGVAAHEGLTVDMSTITLNRAQAVDSTGGGLWSDEEQLTIRNSIVAANTAGGGSPDLRPGGGTLTVLFSIIGDNDGTVLVESQTPNILGNIIGSAAGGGVINPRLAPLANNGGPTETHRILPGSPAFNTGDPAVVANALEFDQRGTPFFRVRQGRLDIGAFESQVFLDANAEIGTWAAGTVLVDINGDFVFNPTNPVLTERDVAYRIGFGSDYIFAGNFAGPGPDGMFGTPDDTTMLMGDAIADGFDTVAAYGRGQDGQYRWLIDINGNGAPDFTIIDPAGINGFPVAGNFDGNFGNGDEVGIFTGTTWHFDTNHDYRVDTSFSTGYAGFPIAGDFDGDGDTDVATYVASNGNDIFFVDLNTAAASGDIVVDGAADFSFHMGSPGSFGFAGSRERPVAADFNEDGIDDIGLWVPDGIVPVPNELAEWYILISGDDPLTTDVEVTVLDRIQTDQINNFIPFSPAPFGTDLYIQFGNTFALPIAGNFPFFSPPEPPPPEIPPIPIIEGPALTSGPPAENPSDGEDVAAVASAASPQKTKPAKQQRAERPQAEATVAVATIATVVAAPTTMESAPAGAAVKKAAKPQKQSVKPEVTVPVDSEVVATVAANESTASKAAVSAPVVISVTPLAPLVAEPAPVIAVAARVEAEKPVTEAKVKEKSKSASRVRSLQLGKSEVVAKAVTAVVEPVIAPVATKPSVVTISIVTPPAVVTTKVDTLQVAEQLKAAKAAAIDRALAEAPPVVKQTPEVVREVAIVQAAAWQQTEAKKDESTLTRRARKLILK